MGVHLGNFPIYPTPFDKINPTSASEYGSLFNDLDLWCIHFICLNLQYFYKSINLQLIFSFIALIKESSQGFLKAARIKYYLFVLLITSADFLLEQKEES